MMEVFTKPEKPPVKAGTDENSIKRHAKYNEMRQKFGIGLEEAAIFGAEWQEATGRLLMLNSKTREAGKAKLADAKLRRKDAKVLGRTK